MAHPSHCLPFKTHWIVFTNLHARSSLINQQYIFTANKCEKIYILLVYGAWIRTLYYESPPLTTGPSHVPEVINASSKTAMIKILCLASPCLQVARI